MVAASSGKDLPNQSLHWFGRSDVGTSSAFLPLFRDSFGIVGLFSTDAELLRLSSKIVVEGPFNGDQDDYWCRG